MPSRPTLTTIDLDYYQRYLDDANLTDEQKKELLETLWGIICEFVRIGYGVHPLQEIAPEAAHEKCFLTEDIIANMVIKKGKIHE